jgi:cytochrome c-type biogenesis protein CcmF
VRPTLIWALFAGAVLGCGIMMGGAWAYESLTFGGYWAWDPVENASLVPWLTLVAALHTLLVYRSTGRSFVSTQLFFILTYLLVWYSTFLTRTGILGDTSVHAFTGAGKSLYWHLLLVIGLLAAISIGLLAKRRKQWPVVKTEEQTATREFWMFIGSFVLLLSAVQILLSTSIPVWSPLTKAITGKDVAPPVDPVAHYNSIQVWVAIVIGILSASVLFLKYKQTSMRTAWKQIGLAALVGLVLSLAISLFQKIDAWQYALLLFAACFTLAASVHFIFVRQRGKLGKAGAAITHFGFALMLVGIVLSSYKKEVLSYNTLGQIIDYGKKTMAENVQESRENVMLFYNTPVPIGPYTATYRGDSVSAADPRTFYKVSFERKDASTGKTREAFTVYPDAFINPKGQQGLVANPASKHYLTRDIFTYVTVAMDPSKQVDTAGYKPFTLHKGDTAFMDNGYIVFEGFNTKVSHKHYLPQQGDLAVSATLSVHDITGATQMLAPVYYIRKNQEYTIDDTAQEKRVYVRFAKILPDQNAAEIQIKKANPQDDYIVLKVLLFPYINLLWWGVIIMALGFLISMVHRMR